MPSLTAYTSLTALFVVTPGASTAMVVRSALEGGRPGGVLTASGIALGNAIYALGAGLGLATLLLAHPNALAVIKIGGAAYLVVQGLQSLWRVWRARQDGTTSPMFVASDDLSRAHGHWFRLGLLTNLLNPSIPVFYASYVPQFVVAGPTFASRFALLGAIHVSMAFAVHVFYALTLGRASGIVLRPHVRLAIQGVTGGALVALGLRMMS
ncbi:MAG: LysE family translocator [Vicinamibacterales bacterium]